MRPVARLGLGQRPNVLAALLNRHVWACTEYVPACIFRLSGWLVRLGAVVVRFVSGLALSGFLCLVCCFPWYPTAVTPNGNHGTGVSCWVK